MLAVAPQRFSIAGHSLGGWVAQEVAALRWQWEMGADEYIRQLKALAADYSTEDLLPRITADTSVIHGRQDRVVVEEEVEFLADGIAGAGLALIEEAGHCSPIEQPQAFTGDAAPVDALAFHALYRSGRQRAHGR